MNFLTAIFPKPTPFRDTEPLRARDGQFAPSPRTMRETSRRASVNAQLGDYVALTSIEQRKSDTDAFLARKIAGRKRRVG